MSLSLLSVYTCGFGGCALHFANLYDLIAHVEYVHIPLIEEEHRQKSAAAAASGEDQRVAIAPNLPLSCFQRVYPTPQRPNSVPQEVFKLSFNHYRKRQICADDESTNDANVNEESEECQPSDPEMRFRCQYVDCSKRFKNITGLRFHMRSAHGISAGVDDLSGAVVTAEGVQPNYQPPPANPSPTKYAASRPYKCQQCSKRYKTTQGLQNHVSQAHQKLNSNEPPSPSPAVVAQLITQARAYGQQTAQAQAQAAAERAAQSSSAHSVSTQSSSSSSSLTLPRPPPLPVSVAANQPPPSLPPATASYAAQSNPPLPVRSIHVQPTRVVSQPAGTTHSAVPTTGQLLQQQMMQQRRQKQLQQQQQQQHGKPAQYQQSTTQRTGGFEYEGGGIGNTSPAPHQFARPAPVSMANSPTGGNIPGGNQQATGTGEQSNSGQAPLSVETSSYMPV